MKVLGCDLIPGLLKENCTTIEKNILHARRDFFLFVFHQKDVNQDCNWHTHQKQNKTKQSWLSFQLPIRVLYSQLHLSHFHRFS